VAYFASRGKNSSFTTPECEIYTLASPGEDYVGAHEALQAALPPHRTQSAGEKAERPTVPSGSITLSGLAAAEGAVLPENAIVVDESMTSGTGNDGSNEGSSAARQAGK
jgi:acetolactate synthase-1/2/3 large subunit